MTLTIKTLDGESHRIEDMGYQQAESYMNAIENGTDTGFIKILHTSGHKITGQVLINIEYVTSVIVRE